ncbi:MAG: hypothetical protein Kow00121_32440 [Elainellaceae cyanobacterium]
MGAQPPLSSFVLTKMAMEMYPSECTMPYTQQRLKRLAKKSGAMATAKVVESSGYVGTGASRGSYIAFVL